MIVALIAQAGARPGIATLAIEVGDGQAERVAALLAGAGFHSVRIEVDLGGIKLVGIGERG